MLGLGNCWMMKRGKGKHVWREYKLLTDWIEDWVSLSDHSYKYIWINEMCVFVSRTLSNWSVKMRKIK